MFFRRLISLLIVTLFTAPLTFAGFHYKAVTVTHNDQNGQQQNTEVEAWVEGEKAKVLFLETDNPLAQKGSYIVTEDGGKTMYLVNPDNETYSEWDMQAMMDMATQALSMVKGVMKLEFTDPEVEKLEDGVGPEMVGLPTKYRKFKTHYWINMKMFGMKRYQEVETVQEFWSTDRIQDEAMGLWLRQEPPKTGDENFDKMIRAEMEKQQGFPLKATTVTVNKQYNRKKTKVKNETTTTTEMRVTELTEKRIDESIFKIPEGYQQVDSPMSPGEENDRPSFRDIFNRGN